MKNVKKYRYGDWWNGKVVLEYATVKHLKGDEPTFAVWEDFPEEDIQKIKEKQKELFEQSVEKLLEDHRGDFIKRQELSDFKELLIEKEIKKCLDIMFEEIPNKILVYLPSWDIEFDYKYLKQIQDYVEWTIIGGNGENFDYIHSPNCRYLDVSKPENRVFARFVWEYFKWLNPIAQNTNPNKRKKSAEEHLWYEFGVHYITGEIAKIKEENPGINDSNIAKKLGNKDYAVYLSQSKTLEKNDKNIFSDPKKMDILENHCNQNDIPISQDYLNQKKEFKKNFKGKK